MSSARIGRRRRHKRAKTRSQAEEWRRWSWRRRGIEFARLQAFQDEPADVVHVAGFLRQLEPGQTVVELTECPAPGGVVTVRRFEVLQRREWAYIYGRRRRRRLASVLREIVSSTAVPMRSPTSATSFR